MTRKRKKRERKLRVLALVRKGLKPPDDLEGVDEKEINLWKMEYDVLAALDALGHEAECLDVSYDLSRIREAVERFEPHVVFNMLEDFHGYVSFDQNVVAYLELLRAPYSGCNPRGLVLSRDKAVTKKILTYHRIPVPPFQVFPRGKKIGGLKKLSYPVIVKSLAADASIGIAQASVVRDEEQLRTRVAFVHEQIGDAICEAYVDGRELYVGVLGNVRLQVFPTWELKLDKLPDGVERIATEHIKFNLDYQRKHDIRSEKATGLPKGVAERIERLARRMYRVLGLSGYARFDLRMNDAGELFVLEANANPDLSRDEDFALSAAAAGLSYEQLVQRILNLGLSYHAAWSS